MCHKICGTCKFEDSACSSLLCFLNRPQDMIGVVNRNSLYYNFKIERFSIFLPCFIPWRSFRFAGRGKSGFSFFFPVLLTLGNFRNYARDLAFVILAMSMPFCSTGRLCLRRCTSVRTLLGKRKASEFAVYTAEDPPVEGTEVLTVSCILTLSSLPPSLSRM